jgi:DNA excision repair protein ERCC-2
MRHAAQCLGRVLRGKDDYGIMVLADRRFLKKRTQLPKWINQAILESEINLSTDMAVGSAKKFLRGMAQPFKPKDQEGISTWSIRDLEKFKEKQEEESIRQLREGMADTAVGDRGAQNGQHGADDHDFDDDELEASMMEL